jgi:hypothetical protein
MKLRLETIPVYTLTGKKTIYKLGDMAYGQWLIFKDGLPFYYFDIFNELYKDLEGPIKNETYNFLKKSIEKHDEELKLSQNIWGIWSSDIQDKWFDLEMLPLSFFE